MMGSSYSNETRILRDRLSALADAADRARAGGPAFKSARQLVKVFQETTIPTAADKFYATHPCDADGTEGEGQVPTFTCDDGATLYVDFIRGAPQAGDYAVATAVGGRWVAEIGGTPAGCTFQVCATGCPDDTPIQGTVAHIYHLDGSSASTDCLADETTGCCILVVDGAPGTFIVSWSKTGYKPWSGEVDITCGGSMTVVPELDADTDEPAVTFTITGCCGAPLEGAKITISDGQSCTTDASGQCSFWIGKSGTYTYTITAGGSCGSRYAPATGSFDIGFDCGADGTQAIPVTLIPASGYQCGFVTVPLPETLHLTDSLYGSCTLTYDGVSAWKGSIPGASYPAQDYGPIGGGPDVRCPATTWTPHYSFGIPSCTTPTVGVAFNAAHCCSCAVSIGVESNNGQIVPSDAIGPAVCTSDPTPCHSLGLFQQSAAAPGTWAGVGDCPLDVTLTIPQTLCGGFPCGIGTGGTDSQIWTNFGASITVTE